MMDVGYQQALKEWAIAIAALTAGQTLVLLRKGGIREQQGKFSVKCDRIILYPTYEHQKPHLLKPEYGDRVQPVESGWHPQTLDITAWADITETLTVSHEPTLQALYPFHIWNEQFIQERLKWKPREPLQVLLLRVYKLLQPISIAYHPEYGGCKSWIELLEPIPLQPATPVLSDEEYARRCQEIRTMIDKEAS